MAVPGTSALQFILRLNDQVTGPMGRVMRTVSGQAQAMSASVTRATGIMQSGFLLAAGGALGLVGALKPAIEHSRALGEVRSLGVAADAMEHLNRSAMRFAAQFGGDATEVVRSAYDIQSAIAGLRGDELARFTGAANLTAKATKASAGEVTAFFGTMHGIFQREAAELGRARWVEQIAGQTAQTVQMFKTTGPQLSRAFTAIGANATSMGVSMAEQFAVLGTLQATMPGPEAGTRYRALLAGLGKAQSEFGLQFTDSSGKLLALPRILDLIRPKLAGLSALQRQQVLQKAFGSQEAVGVVQLLIGQSEELQRSIGALGRTRGLGPAVEMAQEMVDPWQRLGAAVQNLRIQIGSVLLPILNPLVERMTAGTAAIQAWTERFPHLTRLLGLAGLAVFGLALGVALLKITFGVLLFSLLPVVWTFKLLRWAIWGSTAALAAHNGQWRIARGVVLATNAVLWLARAAQFAWLVTLYAVIPALAGAAAGAWAFTAALLANPITWIVVGILALIAGLVLAVVYWDKLKAAAGAVVDWILNKLGALTDAVRGFFGPGTVLGGLLGTLGIDVSGGAVSTTPASLARLPAPESLSGQGARALSNIANSSDNRRQVRIDRLTIEPKEKVGPDYLLRVLAAEAQG